MRLAIKSSLHGQLTICGLLSQDFKVQSQILDNAPRSVGSVIKDSTLHRLFAELVKEIGCLYQQSAKLTAWKKIPMAQLKIKVTDID